MSPAPNDSLIPAPVSVPIPEPEVNAEMKVEIPHESSERCVEPQDQKNIRVRGVTE